MKPSQVVGGIAVQDRPLIRIRTAVVEKDGTSRVFRFTHQGQTCMVARLLPPEVLVESDATLFMGVSRHRAVIDSGRLFVRRSLGHVVLDDFSWVYQTILSRPVRCLSGSYLEPSDDVKIAVHQGFFARARRYLRDIGDDAILEVSERIQKAPLPDGLAA